jgi:hypothetical protein
VKIGEQPEGDKKLNGPPALRLRRDPLGGRANAKSLTGGLCEHSRKFATNGAYAAKIEVVVEGKNNHRRYNCRRTELVAGADLLAILIMSRQSRCQKRQ